ncbi:hypothetical protein ABPG75_004938 [Micractinium tetrahymenae]
MGRGGQQAVPLVSCRWRRLADDPQLLRQLDAKLLGEAYAERYLGFAKWLAPRAAHVRLLSVAALPGTPLAEPSDEDEGYAAQATVGLLAACAAAGQLTSLSLELGAPFWQGSWLPALRTLRRLRIEAHSLTPSIFEAPIPSLLALRELELGDWPLSLESSARLSASLTRLQLRYVDTDLLPEQLAVLTCLHTLSLHALTHDGAAYGALAVLSCLRQLSLSCCRALPASLSQLPFLEALSIDDQGGLMDQSENEPASALAMALPCLTQLTQLALLAATPGGSEHARRAVEASPLMPHLLAALPGRSRLQSLLLAAGAPAGAQLPPGLAALHELAAPAALLGRTLPAVAAATSLQLVGVYACNDATALPAILRWAVRLPALNVLLLEAGRPYAEEVERAALLAHLEWHEQSPSAAHDFNLHVVPNAAAVLVALAGIRG